LVQKGRDLICTPNIICKAFIIVLIKILLQIFTNFLKITIYFLMLFPDESPNTKRVEATTVIKTSSKNDKLKLKQI